MFLVWTILTGLYAVSFIQLLAASEFGGAIIVGAVAVGFALLSRQSWYKHKNRRANRRAKRL